MGERPHNSGPNSGRDPGLAANFVAAPAAGLRPLTALDAPWLAAQHGRVFAPPWSAASFAQMLALPTHMGFASACAQGFILASAVVDEGEILTLMVAPEARGRGLGRALLTTALDALTTAGVRSVFLEVAPSRHMAVKLYTAVGFLVSGRRKAYYSDGEDALVMTWKPQHAL